MGKFNKIVIGVAIMVLILVASLFVFDVVKEVIYNADEQSEKTNIEPKKESKPSYEYLKSICVYITGSIPSETLEDGTIRLGSSWSGTGGIIKIDKEYTYILTNAHVAGDKKKGVILFVDNGMQKVEAEIVAFHRNIEVIDLAVIKVRGKLKGKRAIKGFAYVYPQDKIFLVGNYMGIKSLYAEGCMSGYHGVYDVHQLPICFGNSGSVVCDKNGNLVGVVFAGFRVGFFGFDTAKAICVSSLSVQIFLERLGLK